MNYRISNSFKNVSYEMCEEDLRRITEDFQTIFNESAEHWQDLKLTPMK